MTDHGSTCLCNCGEGHLPCKRGPAWLSACRNPQKKWRPDANPAWIWDTIAANNPGRRPGPCLPYRRHLGPVTLTPCSQTGKIVPWARCAETAPHPPNWCCFIQFPKFSCPGPLWRPVCSRTIMAPSASSVCVCGPVSGSAHIPQRPLVAKALSAGPPQSSPADVIGDDDDDDDDPGETRTLLLRGTPGESCGGYLLRTLSGDLSKAMVPHCCAPHFWSSFLPALPWRTLATPNLQGGDGGGAAGKTAGTGTEARPALFLLEPTTPGLHWLQVLGLLSKTMFWSLFCRSLECPSTPALQKPRHFLPF